VSECVCACVRACVRACVKQAPPGFSPLLCKTKQSCLPFRPAAQSSILAPPPPAHSDTSCLNRQGIGQTSLAVDAKIKEGESARIWSDLRLTSQSTAQSTASTPRSMGASPRVSQSKVAKPAHMHAQDRKEESEDRGRGRLEGGFRGGLEGDVQDSGGFRV